MEVLKIIYHYYFRYPQWRLLVITYIIFTFFESYHYRKDVCHSGLSGTLCVFRLVRCISFFFKTQAVSFDKLDLAKDICESKKRARFYSPFFCSKQALLFFSTFYVLPSWFDQVPLYSRGLSPSLPSHTSRHNRG